MLKELLNKVEDLGNKQKIMKSDEVFLKLTPEELQVLKSILQSK